MVILTEKSRVDVKRLAVAQNLCTVTKGLVQGLKDLEIRG